MAFRSSIAAALGKSAHWAGKTFMHRSPGNLAGVLAMKAAPLVLCDLAKKVDTVVVISGTNGKTTTTNLVADCLAKAGRPLHCNRDGNNLESGVVTALLVRPEMQHAQGCQEQPVACFE